MDSASLTLAQATGNTASNATTAGKRLPFDAVLWDIDGTLLDSEPIHELAFEIACSEIGLDHGAIKSANSFLGSTEQVLHQCLVDQFNLSLSFAEWSLLKFNHYLSHIEEIHPHPEAFELWTKLDSFMVTQAVVSNAERMVVQVNLERLGLNTPGMISVSRNDVREGKPNPEPYLRAAYLLGLKPDRCVAVEDSSPGAASAYSAGMKVYSMPWLAGEMRDKTADLLELKRLIELVQD